MKVYFDSTYFILLVVTVTGKGGEPRGPGVKKRRNVAIMVNGRVISLSDVTSS